MRAPNVAAALAVLGLGVSVWADVITFDGSAGVSWHTASNWDSNSVPTADDRAVIPAGLICDITSGNATADTLVVESTGILNIRPGRTLTLENDNQNESPTDDSLIDGFVLLDTTATIPPTAGATLAFIERNHIIYGEGTIFGTHETLCKITIAAEIGIRNDLATADNGIRGNMTIEGASGETNGLFLNNGLVEATNKGAIIFASTTELEDNEGALWAIYNCLASMVFNREEQGLVGDFRGAPETGGTFFFNQNIKTCGTYTRNCSKIDVGSSKWFAYVGFVSGVGSCGNPGTYSPPLSCSSPYFVLADDGNLACGEDDP